MPKMIAVIKRFCTLRHNMTFYPIGIDVFQSKRFYRNGFFQLSEKMFCNGKHKNRGKNQPTLVLTSDVWML